MMANYQDSTIQFRSQCIDTVNIYHFYNKRHMQIIIINLVNASFLTKFSITDKLSYKYNYKLTASNIRCIQCIFPKVYIKTIEQTIFSMNSLISISNQATERMKRSSGYEPLQDNQQFVQSLDIHPPSFKVYHFPPQHLSTASFDTPDDLKVTLDLALRNHNQNASVGNRVEKTLVIRQKEGKVILKCKVHGCKALLELQTQGKKLKFTIFETQHRHSPRQTKRGRTPKVLNHEVEECYDELQLLNFKPHQILKFICSKFRISTPHFYGIKYQRNRREIAKNLFATLSKIDYFHFQCKDIHQILARYHNQAYDLNSKKQERDVIILVSQKMKQLYDSYHGQYVLFSVFPDLVLETRYVRKLKYQHLGVLYGEDTSNSPRLLFGLVIFRRPVRYAYLYILETLFNFLKRYPKVLVTDYDPALAQSIRRLQNRYASSGALKLHIQLPNSFITHSFPSKISPQFLSTLSGDLEYLLRQPDRKKHEERLRKLKVACESNPLPAQDRISDKVEDYVKNNSLLQLKPFFIGLTLTPYSTAGILRARVLDFFKSPRPMILAVKAFLEIFKAYPILKYLSKQQIEARLQVPKDSSANMLKLQTLQLMARHLDPSTKIKKIAKLLASPAQMCLYDSLQQCFKGEVELIQQQNYYYYKIRQGINYPYVIRRILEPINGEMVRLWRCECRYFHKVGIPCWHELKVCLVEKSDVTPQINPYWLRNVHTTSRGKPINEHDIKHRDDMQFAEYAQQKENERHIQTSGIGGIMRELSNLQWNIEKDQFSDEEKDYQNFPQMVKLNERDGQSNRSRKNDDLLVIDEEEGVKQEFDGLFEDGQNSQQLGDEEEFNRMLNVFDNSSIDRFSDRKKWDVEGERQARSDRNSSNVESGSREENSNNQIIDQINEIQEEDRKIEPDSTPSSVKDEYEDALFNF